MEEAERRDHVPYRLWARQGFIETTPGRAIDKAFVVHRMGELTKDYDVQFCAADRWRLDEIARLMAEGQRQDRAAGVRARLEGLWGRRSTRSRRPCCAVSCATLGTPCSTCALPTPSPRKLVKERATGRIDGLVAATMAIGAAVKTAPKKESIYKTRGLVSLRVA